MENNTNIDLKALAEALKLQLGVEHRETLNITKNTKGYNWDIKIFFNETDEATIERLDKLKSAMNEKFGVSND
jgi:hypothetical protein